MKFILRFVLVLALVFVLGNEPPRKQAVAQVKTPVAVITVETHPNAPIEQTAPVETPQPPQATPPTTHEEMMTAAGIPADQWAAADYIISHESGWRPCVVNGGEINCAYIGERAFGLCQSLPASKMASAGSDYQTNPVTQLIWCNSYAQGRYGGWWGAYSHWQKFRWW